MMFRGRGRSTRFAVRPSALVGLLLAAAIGPLTVWPGHAGAVSNVPVVSITPVPMGGAFPDQQVVRISVGPNSLFVPRTRVVILECTDPGGSAANLPTKFDACDENTIQGDTTVVQADGSFVEPGYTLYALPSAALGEQSNWQPVCNSTNKCVLFIGEDQKDFTQPKIFSQPFSMTTTTPSTATPAATATTAPAGPSVSAAVSLSATQLAFTGASNWLALLAGGGVLLILVSVSVARMSRRSGQ
jgi:hypothetical protein